VTSGLDNRDPRAAHDLALLHAFASGIGHELANLVAPINVRLACLRDETAHLSTDDLAGIRASVERVQRLGEGLQLLGVGEDPASSASPMPLGVWWHRAEPLLRAILPRGTTMEWRVEESAAERRVPASALTAILFSLALRLCPERAAGAGGLVTFTAGCEESWAVVGLRKHGAPPADREDTVPMEIDRYACAAGGVVRPLDARGGEHGYEIRFPAALPASGAHEPRLVFVGVSDERSRAVVTAELALLSCESTHDASQRAACVFAVVDGPPGEKQDRRGIMVLSSAAGTGSVPASRTIDAGSSVRLIRETLRTFLHTRP
jgi:hypothetical protein